MSTQREAKAVIKFSDLRVELNLTTPLLGSSPATKDLHSQYVASKAASPWQAEEENSSVAAADKGVTVFPQDSTGLFLWNYQIKGFIKHAGNILKDAAAIKNLRGKLDDYLFVQERKVYLRRDGAVIVEEDEVLERPLRAMTMQGPRVSLAASEMVNPPASLTFTIRLLEHKEEKINMGLIRNLLDYGALHGLGQWRNGGYGQFEWRELS